jgi:hypothetical protein
MAFLPSLRSLRTGNILWLVPTWLVGAALRLYGVPSQVLVGDENHGLRVAVTIPLSEILTVYRPVDPCIPLAALYRVLGDAGVGLSELVVRLPSVLAGLAVLVGFPWFLARQGGGDRRAWTWAAVFAWLLAISPGLVYYSRIARPYAVIALLAPLAAAAFWRWWRGGGAGWAAVYAVAGAASAWFHLATVPFVVAPLAFGAVDLVARQARRSRKVPAPGRSFLALAAVGTGLAAGIAAFLVPAWPSLVRLVRVKADDGALDLTGLWEVARLEAGTAAWLTVLFWIAAAAGAASLARRLPVVTAYAACLVAAQWLGVVVVLRPSGIDHALVVHRYVLPTLPVVLLAVSWSLARGWDWGRERRGAARWLAAGAVAASLAVLSLTGPYAADPGLRLGPFAGTNEAASFVAQTPELPPELVPRIYELIGGEPGHGAVVEAPSRFASYTQGPSAAFARVHGRPVVLAVPDPWVADGRLALRTAAPETPSALLATGARFVVVHLDRPRWFRLLEDPGSPAAARPPPARHPSVVRAHALAGKLRRAWGEPHLVDGDVLVWDLARLEMTTGRSRGRAGARRRPDRGAGPRPRH